MNYFLRDGSTAAHLVLRAGPNPRLLVVFPAGNSGTGLWFQPTAGQAQWMVDTPPRKVTAADERGRALHGIEFTASLAAPALTVRQAVLSNVRVLRDYDQDGTVPAQVAVGPTVADGTVTWARDRLDGAPGYRLNLQVVDGTVAAPGTITAGQDGRIRVHATALTGDAELTPLTGAALLNGAERDIPSARDTLTFLSYREKFLAGSWHFDTYFGRDTLISLMLLMPVLAPEATAAGLRSVLSRLGPGGEVAHEEAISEYAILTHLKQNGTLGDAPVFDYGMIDESYLLAPVIAAYLLDDPNGKSRAGEFLRSGSNGAALVRNLRLVVSSAAAFTHDPRYPNLIGLQPGHPAGEWRDSNNGLGGGHYPYDVNAILVPAALTAAQRLLDSKVLDPFLTPEDRQGLSECATSAKVWRAEAPPLFTVTVDNARAGEAITSYAEKAGVPPQDASTALGSTPVSFPGIALDAIGAPIPIMHSDDTYALLLDLPTPEALDRAVTTMTRPFPLGLMTPVGPVVANPAFAPALQPEFTTHDYHGTVIWSWVQAALARGLQRQLARTDLPTSVRTHLQTAQKTLWQAINATASMENSELWSWHHDPTGYHPDPFGATGADVTESDAAQLWSTAYLAISQNHG
ncbi:hypothetical protein ACIP5Y_38840 [Nocardia sp. NPDC088792]|uniref:hypothetical protein n=1 Tax=Nocardia sp. NPDC088792 TaxID=3364332 RepID=UPI00380E4FF2